MEWEHLVGFSAGAGLPGSRLLGVEVSFADCLALCEADAACTAVDFVRKHSESAAAAPLARRRCAEASAKPRKRSCYAVAREWSPCVPAHTENIASRALGPRAAPPSSARSVLLVVFDDLRPVDAPFEQSASPVARAFAAGAATFLSAHAQAALCAPSRASFLSGRPPALTRVWWTDTHLRAAPAAAAWLTLPGHFKRAGYYVAGVGKLFHHLPDPASLDPASWSEPECVADFPYYGQGHCPEKAEYLLAAYNTSAGCPLDEARHAEFAYPDAQVLRKARQFLAAAAAARRPFWLGVGFFKPHKPFVFPARLLAKQPSAAPPPANGAPAAGGARMASIGELCATKPSAWRAACGEDTRRAYHAAAAHSDGLFGELLLTLAAGGGEESTLVVAMSDHGFALGEHGAWAKWSNWEVATRSVWMVRAPWLRAAAGARLAAPVQLLDLFPTVAELAGVPLPAGDRRYDGVRGRSLAPLLRRPSNESGGAAAFSQMARCWPEGGARNASSYGAMAQCDGVPPALYAFMGYSVRTAAARYTEWVPLQWDGAARRHLPQWGEAAERELYDHAADDGGTHWSSRFEAENVAAARPAEAARMRQLLHAHFDAENEAALRTGGAARRRR